MPEAPNPKHRPVVPPPSSARGTSSRLYAELDVTTNFSFLRGASHPDELIYRAAELGHAAIAVTDVNSLGGVARAHQATKEIGIKLCVGSLTLLFRAAASSPSVMSGFCRMSSLSRFRSASSSLLVSGRCGGLGSSDPVSRSRCSSRRTHDAEQLYSSATSIDDPHASYAVTTASRNSIGYAIKPPCQITRRLHDPAAGRYRPMKSALKPQPIIIPHIDQTQTAQLKDK